MDNLLVINVLYIIFILAIIVGIFYKFGFLNVFLFILAFIFILIITMYVGFLNYDEEQKLKDRNISTYKDRDSIINHIKINPLTNDSYLLDPITGDNYGKIKIFDPEKSSLNLID